MIYILFAGSHEHLITRRERGAMRSSVARFIVFCASVPSFCLPLVYRQNCATRSAQCRLPFEDRDATTIAQFHTPNPGKMHPPGHLRPLGHSSFDYLWEGTIRVVSGAAMEPKTFWRSYHGREPVLFAGAAVSHPAYKKWDDSYITDNFGQFKAKVEHKNEDRLTDYCWQMQRGQAIQCNDEEIKPYQG